MFNIFKQKSRDIFVNGSLVATFTEQHNWHIREGYDIIAVVDGTGAGMTTWVRLSEYQLTSLATIMNRISRQYRKIKKPGLRLINR